MRGEGAVIIVGHGSEGWDLQAGDAAVVVAAVIGSDMMDPLHHRDGQRGEQGVLVGRGDGWVSGVWQGLHRRWVSQ